MKNDKANTIRKNLESCNRQTNTTIHQSQKDDEERI